MFRPSILDNVASWKVFDDDHQITHFLTSQDTFKDVAFNEDDHEISLSDPNFPSNLIPKSILNLEKYYDLHDKFKRKTNCKTHSLTPNFQLDNLGTEKNPQLINLKVNFSPDKKKSFIKLCKEFKDVFSQKYDDLKNFDTKIIQHNIPMKPSAKPYQQNLRMMHSSLEPSVKK